MNCKETQIRFEQHNEGAQAQLHLQGCRECSEYAALQGWSARVLTAGRLEVTPPLMSSVWASIHRASEQAWDSALTRSFRYLLPYMVAVVAIILLVGGLGLRNTANTAGNAVAAASSSTSPFALFNAPDQPPVAQAMVAPLGSGTPDPADLLAAAHNN